MKAHEKFDAMMKKRWIVRNELSSRRAAFKLDSLLPLMRIAMAVLKRQHAHL